MSDGYTHAVHVSGNEKAEVQVLRSNISRRVTVQNPLPSFLLAERLTKTPEKLKMSLVSPFLSFDSHWGPDEVYEEPSPSRIIGVA